MVMRPEFLYTPCATSSRGETGDIIMFAQFGEGKLLNKTSNDAENGEESDDESIMPPLLSEEDTYAMDPGDESENNLISTEMLEDIRGRGQTHTNVNQR